MLQMPIDPNCVVEEYDSDVEDGSAATVDPTYVQDGFKSVRGLFSAALTCW